ncbi:hypothetical protein E2L08_03025 [Palleronia sediminis]|uniref:Uncharacterized protein n=1 Tax=Palleronia sediminis TaxID=2547833 RepID=A0A4R6AJU9_9RHOB|nr:hypothetical protein [Palleronia sediminis]TDL83635.1 hypothetical protein E2L08_03025 [Palleronia sediminis]
MTPTPWHFWPILTLALVWHLISTADYTATQYDWEPWLKLMTERQQGFVQTMPDWVDALWAVTAWAGLLGVVLAIFRVGIAPFVLSVSAIAAIVTAAWFTVFPDPSLFELAGWLGLIVLWGSAAFAVALWLYVRDMHKIGTV